MQFSINYQLCIFFLLAPISSFCILRLNLHPGYNEPEQYVHSCNFQDFVQEYAGFEAAYGTKKTFLSGKIMIFSTKQRQIPS